MDSSSALLSRNQKPNVIELRYRRYIASFPCLTWSICRLSFSIARHGDAHRHHDGEDPGFPYRALLHPGTYGEFLADRIFSDPFGREQIAVKRPLSSGWSAALTSSRGRQPLQLAHDRSFPPPVRKVRLTYRRRHIRAGCRIFAPIS